MINERMQIWTDPASIPSETRDKLWFFISRDIDAILQKFYQRIGNSNLHRILDGLDIDKLTQKQKTHWRRILLYRVDETYDVRLRNMHAYHIKIGLTHSHYIASYFFLMNLFQKAILKHASGPKEAYDLIVALQSIISEDITRALGVDAETGQDAGPSAKTIAF
ncbi:hypothetical protein GGD81_003798 [Rhodobium orientis]|nr:protoglobin domain-containing protein [Rhodobium orientis]MBB4304734.1 hypothetical protein [Rhodobium orientis]